MLGPAGYPPRRWAGLSAALPYGCVEQTVSSAFPLLYLSDLANRLRPQSMGRDEPAALVQAAVLRVLSMQTPSGAFAAWPFSTVPYAWGSLYATHFLVEADKARFAVPREPLAGALQFLRTRLDAAVVTDATPTNTAWQADMEERAYAAYVLALAGQPDRGWTARLREEAPRLRFSARVHAAAALMFSGDPRAGGAMLTSSGSRRPAGRATSAARSTAPCATRRSCSPPGWISIPRSPRWPSSSRG